MIWLDWLIIAAIIYGTFCGMRRGLVLSLFSLGGLAAAVVIGWQYAAELVSLFERRWEWHSRMTTYLSESISVPQHADGIVSPEATHAELAEGVLTVIAFFLIFSSVVIAAGVLARMIHLAVGWGFTGAIDRIMGGVLGLCAAAVGAAVALGILLITSTSVPALQPGAEAIHNSVLGPELVRIFYGISPLSDMLSQWLT